MFYDSWILQRSMVAACRHQFPLLHPCVIAGPPVLDQTTVFKMTYAQVTIMTSPATLHLAPWYGSRAILCGFPKTAFQRFTRTAWMVGLTTNMTPSARIRNTTSRKRKFFIATPAQRSAQADAFAANRTTLTRQHGSAIHVEHFAGDEAGMRRTQEQDRRRDFFRRSHPSEWNRSKDPGAALRIIQRRHRHVSLHPSRSHAIYIDAIAGQFGGKPLDHADERAFAGGVVAMKRLAALSGGGTDQHDVPGCSA